MRSGMIIGHSFVADFSWKLCHPATPSGIAVEVKASNSMSDVHLLSTIGSNDIVSGAQPQQLTAQITWWRHQMETFSALLALCVGKSPVTDNSIPRTKASDAELLCFLWYVYARINGWVNNREAGDLRRHRVHFDVIVMNYRIGTSATWETWRRKRCHWNRLWLTHWLPLTTSICDFMYCNDHLHRIDSCDKYQAPHSTTHWTQKQQIWWRHQMEMFSALLALCEGNPSVTGGFPSQRPVTRSFGVFFHLRLNKRLSKQQRRWWFETPLRSVWRHCNEVDNQSKYTEDAILTSLPEIHKIFNIIWKIASFNVWVR